MAEDTKGGGVGRPQAPPAQRPQTPQQRPTGGPALAVKGPQFPQPVFKGEPGPSIIPADVRHEIVAAGFYGSGKTTFILGIDDPRNVCMVDFEGKGESIANQLKVENYFHVPREVVETIGFDYRPAHWFERTRQIVEALPQDRFTTFILDGFTFFQGGTVEKVKQTPSVYGIDPAKPDSFGGPYKGVKYLLNYLYTILRSKGVKVVGVTTEAGAKWGKEGPIFNKYEVKGVDLLHKMSVLTVLMMPGYPQYNGAPSALVLKEQLGSYSFVEGQGMVVKRRLPPKLPWAMMGEVYRYLKEPADWTPGGLKPQEIPTDEEMAPFSYVISKDQLATLKDFLAAARLIGGAEDGGVEG